MDFVAARDGGTGSRFGRVIIILTGVASLLATLTTVVAVWLQTKNYRKPLLQRYVVRILLMVPIYSISSWVSLISMKASDFIDPFRDVYEAFTIYTFVQLLINFLGGERSLLIMTYGRRPVRHLWPLTHCLPPVDISDPYTFLAIKRGILQYTWMKPTLALATIIMKATGTYQEGYIGLTSGYFWSGIIYNISITISLYALAMFWVIMSQDLKPFRPMPKFLCVKGIIFASYWQGFFLSILVWLGALPDDVPGYSPDNLAVAIQDALICFEMPAFALAHWYAFSWHDYADPTISAARLPIKYALRDAFGPADLIQDTKETFFKSHYDYRHFDARDSVLAHEESSSRNARMKAGMRYTRGKGKYWLPESNGSKKPLLQGSRARGMSSPSRSRDTSQYGTLDAETDGEPELDPDEERLYDDAKQLEFGDWNYPVITAHTANREALLYRDPSIVTASTNRNLLQPGKVQRQKRKSRIQEIQDSSDPASTAAGKKKSDRQDSGSKDQKPLLKKNKSSSGSSSSSANSQLVDLVVEDEEAEEIERVRARKEGSPRWNETDPKHFVRTYHEAGQAEEVREGYAPDEVDPNQPHGAEQIHTLDQPLQEGKIFPGNKSLLKYLANQQMICFPSNVVRNKAFDGRHQPFQLATLTYLL
ncbi:DUF300-domain-containing protein [Microthyrium microscopicum]|uniref:DUF300-domain-containing protein n=1 Tax=Microthyrium microscopicum TaxID=703497 RepID=A0A6A6UB68_9PEZI|nr:DUF300-domain-containing protein [Microthyrium microscopicum]